MLVSIPPVPRFVKMIPNTPCEILESASHLKATSVALVSLVFNCQDIPKKLWFYIYDEDKLFARVYSPSYKSSTKVLQKFYKSSTNAPQGCLSLQAEIYFYIQITNRLIT